MHQGIPSKGEVVRGCTRVLEGGVQAQAGQVWNICQGLQSLSADRLASLQRDGREGLKLAERLPLDVYVEAQVQLAQLSQCIQPG